MADVEPRYSGEWNASAWESLATFLIPSVVAGGPVSAPEQVAERTAWVRGLPMAKAALEMAVLDVWLRARDTSLAEHLGAVADRVPCGVSVGIAASAEAMLEEIRGYLDKGYQRVKLKIEPGRDLEVVRAVPRRAAGRAALGRRERRVHPRRRVAVRRPRRARTW